MDPNETLRTIAELLLRGMDTRDERADLTEWLARGGFPPEWEAYPEASDHYREHAPLAAGGV